MYETFDHTADLGLRIRADNLNHLFADAGKALFSVLVANPESIQLVREYAFRLDVQRRDDLLFDWLAELLYTFDADRVVLARFDVTIDQSILTATAWGESIDFDRHELDVDIKAITYHGLKVVPNTTDDGWLAEVIVDL